MPAIKPDIRLLVSLGLLLPALAQAVDALPGSPARNTPDTAVTSGAAYAANGENGQRPSTSAIAGMGESMPLESLDQYRGGTAVNSIRSEAVSNGLLQDATATNVATGNNTIADGAFSNAVGLPIVIQNSGANVLIQNSTIVNVQFR